MLCIFMFHDFYWIALFTENPKAISKFSKNGVGGKFLLRYLQINLKLSEQILCILGYLPTYFFSSRAPVLFPI